MILLIENFLQSHLKKVYLKLIAYKGRKELVLFELGQTNQNQKYQKLTSNIDENKWMVVNKKRWLKYRISHKFLILKKTKLTIYFFWPVLTGMRRIQQCLEKSLEFQNVARLASRLPLSDSWMVYLLDSSSSSYQPTWLFSELLGENTGSWDEDPLSPRTCWCRQDTVSPNREAFVLQWDGFFPMIFFLWGSHTALHQNSTCRSELSDDPFQCTLVQHTPVSQPPNNQRIQKHKDKSLVMSS